jgi:hypothetical protein
MMATIRKADVDKIESCDALAELERYLAALTLHQGEKGRAAGGHVRPPRSGSGAAGRGSRVAGAGSDYVLGNAACSTAGGVGSPYSAPFVSVGPPLTLGGVEAWQCFSLRANDA